MNLNKGKWDLRNETRKKLQNEILLLTKQNKTKQNFAVFIVS
jgi:hypothetical protein